MVHWSMPPPWSRHGPARHGAARKVPELLCSPRWQVTIKIWKPRNAPSAVTFFSHLTLPVPAATWREAQVRNPRNPRPKAQVFTRPPGRRERRHRLHRRSLHRRGHRLHLCRPRPPRVFWPAGALGRTLPARFALLAREFLRPGSSYVPIVGTAPLRLSRKRAAPRWSNSAFMLVTPCPVSCFSVGWPSTGPGVR